MKLLLVDDDIDCLDSLYLGLKPLNYEMKKTTDPIEALDIIKEDQEISLVITDMKMPEITGIDILKHIKTINNKIGVIVVTAYSDVDSLVQCVNHRAFAFFQKPISILELMKKIKEFEIEFEKKIEDDRKEIVNSIYSEIIYAEYEKLKEAYFELLNYLKKNKKK